MRVVCHYYVLFFCSVIYLSGQIPIADTAAPSSQRPNVEAAANGVPLVQIARPDSSGLSHNLFQQFDVPREGLILNNFNGQVAQSQLGGFLLSNPNLRGGASARVILNEVTGTRVSQILGATEVFGQRASVIVANPNGIFIDGANFLNTGRVTMTTGRPEGDGSNLSFAVNGGKITVAGRGVDATQADSFEIISRAAEITANIHARDIQVIAGRNQVDYTDLDTQTLADDGSEKPEVAISSSALGGMYGDRIKIISTEKGVGVNMEGVTQASAGDLFAQVNGNFKTRSLSSEQNIQIEAQKVEVAEQIYAGDNLAIQGESGVVLEDEARVIATGDISIDATDGFVSVGDDAQLVAGVNFSGNLSSEEQELQIRGERGVDNRGLVASSGRLDVSSGETFEHSGRIVAGDSVSLDSQGDIVFAEASTARVGEDLVLTGSQDAVIDGLIEVIGEAMLHLEGNIDQGGQIRTREGLSIRGSDIELSQTAELNSAGNLNLISLGNLQSSGDISSTGNILVSSGAGLALANSSRLVAAGQVDLNSQQNLQLDHKCFKEVSK